MTSASVEKSKMINIHNFKCINFNPNFNGICTAENVDEINDIAIQLAEYWDSKI